MLPRFLITACALLCMTACTSVRVTGGEKSNIIPWIDAVPPMPTPTLSPVIPSGTPACTTRDLHVTFDGGQGLGGGQLTATISFVNVSGTACFLQGVPGYALLDAHGNVIGTSPSGYRITDRSDKVLLAARGDTRQAYVPFAWPAIDLAAGGAPCPLAPTASAIKLDLPSGGGTQTVAAAPPSLHSIRIAPCHGLLAVGAFQAAEVSVEPTPTSRTFTYKVVLPASVRAGDNLHYTVTFTNAGASPAVFSQPCPTYHEDLYSGNGPTGMPLGKHFYVLNCGAVPVVASRASVTFAMVLDVPASATPGNYTLIWAPEQGVDLYGIQRLPIMVTH